MLLVEWNLVLRVGVCCNLPAPTFVPARLLVTDSMKIVISVCWWARSVSVFPNGLIGATKKNLETEKMVNNNFGLWTFSDQAHNDKVYTGLAKLLGVYFADISSNIWGRDAYVLVLARRLSPNSTQITRPAMATGQTTRRPKRPPWTVRFFRQQLVRLWTEYRLMCT